MQIPLSAPRVPIFCAPRGNYAHVTEARLHVVHSGEPYGKRRVLHGFCFGEELPDVEASSSISSFTAQGFGFDPIWVWTAGWRAEKPPDKFERWDDHLQVTILQRLTDWQQELLDFIALAYKLPPVRARERAVPSA